MLARNPSDVAETRLGPDGILRPAWADRGEGVRHYFDTEWGHPIEDEAGLFELLVLLVFAGGLTWSAVMSRRDVFREAFAGYDPVPVAAFTVEDVERLATDDRMIRNRRKIAAVVTDARAICDLRARGDGLADLVWGRGSGEQAAQPVDVSEIPRTGGRSMRLAVALKDAGFVHIGPVAAQALLLASGVIPVRRGSKNAVGLTDSAGERIAERSTSDLARHAGT